jgi:hypothetical protein
MSGNRLVLAGVRKVRVRVRGWKFFAFPFSLHLSARAYPHLPRSPTGQASKETVEPTEQRPRGSPFPSYISGR